MCTLSVCQKGNELAESVEIIFSRNIMNKVKVNE